MSLIRPFKGLRPVPAHSEDVVAPPYDVLNTEEARIRAKGRPWSFLHISKPEIDLPAEIDPYSVIVYETGAKNLQRQLDDKILVQDKLESYYVYQLTMGEHTQTGIVAVASVQEYDRNRIKKHEFTRPKKEDDRVRQIDALNAQTGPVFLTYRQHPLVDELINKITATPAEVNITADDGVSHTLWPVSDPAVVNSITENFDKMDALYIADGHHRSAAASRVSKMRSSGSQATEADYFLSVIFPDNQMRILDYNRVVKDLNGHSDKEFLSKVENRFAVSKQEKEVKPASPGEFGMYLCGQWYRLKLKAQYINSDDPVKRLDVSLLADNLIDPVLGISDPRTDERIDFVGGIRGLKELEKRVNSGEMQVAFSLFPTSLHDLMSVADDNQVMPPKSTWFEPKLADGLVSYLLS